MDIVRTWFVYLQRNYLTRLKELRTELERSEFFKQHEVIAYNVTISISLVYADYAWHHFMQSGSAVVVASCVFLVLVLA